MQTERTVNQTKPGDWRERLGRRDPSLRVHLIGIGGAGLSAIARVLLEMGLAVSGSDMQAGPVTAHLAQHGAQIFPQQVAANLLEQPADQRPHVVLISSAVHDDNPELAAARQLGLPVVKRTDFLPALLQGRQVIAVAGTHGKSTTTAMIIQVLRAAGLDPGFIVGANLPGLGNAAAGSGTHFVIEADEYDHMFLGLEPAVAVITNVEWDHPDCYPTPSSFRKAFMQFIDRVERGGLVISCSDDEGAETLRSYTYSRGPRWITYGLNEAADMRAVLRPMQDCDTSAADLVWWHAPAGRLRLSVPGVHNIRNALAALAVSSWCNVPLEQAMGSLARYTGVARRFEAKGEAAGVQVFDDYAHHPTEIMATLAAARQRFPDRRIWAVFQPHTFSRTERMLYRMGDSFDHADQVIVTDIFAAREVDDGSVSSAELVAASPHPAIRYIAGLCECADYLAAHTQAGDIVITLGAGDGYKAGEILLAKLQADEKDG
ncbi:MAG: UDP-N-acetylmuramate--L-alanine ligase [Chloroflexota bacterium]|mgnify:FL=1|nr:UDP-N-acetylmuramate--L-alanine ligase [Chloroflexota bacterium]